MPEGMSDNEKRSLIEERITDDGFTAKGWRDDSMNGLTVELGRFVVTTSEYEDEGLFVDDEGELTASVVGSPQYGNVRVAYAFTADDTDCGCDVPDLSALDTVA